MTFIKSGIKKEEFQLPNDQKLVVEYGFDFIEIYPIPADSDDLTDMNVGSHRRLSLFDKDEKLLGTKIEENPHKILPEPGTV